MRPKAEATSHAVVRNALSFFMNRNYTATQQSQGPPEALREPAAPVVVNPLSLEAGARHRVARNSSVRSRWAE